MSALLKWDGDELFLGKTKMAEVRAYSDAFTNDRWEYVLGPNDFVSMSRADKQTARQDCERHVRELLVKAGALRL